MLISVVIISENLWFWLAKIYRIYEQVFGFVPSANGLSSTATLNLASIK